MKARKMKIIGILHLLAALYLTEACGLKQVAETVSYPQWPELPAIVSGAEGQFISHELGSRRNYSMLYDAGTMSASWVAYPLCEADMSSGREESWAYDPKIPQDSQTDVRQGYGVEVSTEGYSRNFYARGHQIPNADRNAVEGMMAQTYYSTNMTPQIQNGFNGGIWSKLETAVREMVPPGDTLYVVTGACYRTRGGNEEIISITNRNDGRSLPVPNYYYKALLKLSKAGDRACCIGFWLPHKAYKKVKYSDFTLPVDSLELLTGVDFFHNLPDSIEGIAESNASLDAFISFEL